MISEIFVFGSNLAGRHGKGAALDAMRNYMVQFMVKVKVHKVTRTLFQQRMLILNHYH